MSITSSQISDFFVLKADPRTADWPLVDNPFYTLVMCLLYLYFVKFLGPKIMEGRKPFQLKNVLIVYNLFQVIFSAWMFYVVAKAGWFSGEYSYRCQPMDYSNKPNTMQVVRITWWFFFSKFTEFFDTIFFVLRKKIDQVSALHVIHHTMVPLTTWMAVRYFPDGHATFFGMANTFVHIIMYSYYFLSAFGPGMQKFLWWKKYITALQMVQFVAAMLHSSQLLFIECDYPKAVILFSGSQAVLFLFLFTNFYKNAYKEKKDARNKENGVTNGLTKTHQRLKQK